MVALTHLKLTAFANILEKSSHCDGLQTTEILKCRIPSLDLRHSTLTQSLRRVCYKPMRQSHEGVEGG